MSQRGAKAEVSPQSASTAMSKLHDEIREANLTYLMLAQQMLRTDRAEALFRLGISSEVADILDGLSNVQLLRVAPSNMLLARVRFDAALTWGLLSSPTAEGAPRLLHAAILMADARRARVRAPVVSVSS